ncbi:F-box domain containing protein [Tanacetum coccineum]
MIECLTISCPLLEEIHLYRCYGFKKICIYGHQNLLKLRIDGIDGLKTIDIKAPKFSHLILKVWVEKIKRINLASCKKLTTLSFTRYSSETTQALADFAHFLSNFPFIENLFLTLPSDCDSLKFSSHSLRTIVLYSQCDFDKFDINAPNLLLFEYCGNSHKPNSLVRRSVEPKARIEYYTQNGLDTLCIMKLRRFLNKKNEFKVFKLVLSGQKPIDVEQLKAIQSPPYELERVELELEFVPRTSFKVVGAVLWCFRPRSLTLKSMIPSVDFKRFILLVAYTYLKLLEQEDERQTNTYLVMSSSSIAEKRFIDLFELLKELPRDRLDQTITLLDNID